MKSDIFFNKKVNREDDESLKRRLNFSWTELV